MSRPLQDVQDEILEDLHAGSPIDREALLLEHAEHASALRRFFALLDVVEATSMRGTSPAASGRLGDFEILRELGRGGMGVVYEARQLSLNRKVALKVLPASSRGDRRSLQRFRREAEAAARLRHPNLVPVYAIGESGGAPFFAMELVDGRSLADVISARARGEAAGVPSDAEAFRAWGVRTLAIVAEALAYAHGQGILHRDVKPANILLEADGTPRLTDFGLALDLEASGITLSGEVFGSPLYMSPEQAFRRSQPLDARTDVYSLAVTLHELLTGRLPYAGTTHGDVMAALSSGDLVPPRDVDRGMPQALEDVLLTALAHDPDRRYASASEFASDLRASLDGGRVAARDARRVARRADVPRHERRARLVVQFVLVVIAIVVPLAFLGMAFMRASHDRADVARSDAQHASELYEAASKRAAQQALIERAEHDAMSTVPDATAYSPSAALDAAMRAALAPRRAVVVQVTDTSEGRSVRFSLETEQAGGPLPAACVIELRATSTGPVLGTARVLVPAAVAEDTSATASGDGALCLVDFTTPRALTAAAWASLHAIESGALPSVRLTYRASPDAEWAPSTLGASWSIAGEGPEDVAWASPMFGASWRGDFAVDVPLGVGEADAH